MLRNKRIKNKTASMIVETIIMVAIPFGIYFVTKNIMFAGLFGALSVLGILVMIGKNLSRRSKRGQ